jgi:serine/threonine-protein kinase
MAGSDLSVSVTHPMSSEGTRPAMPSARVLGGRYRLLARRGTGFDAAVFDAVDDVDKRRVTVKVVHPDLCADPQISQQLRAALDRAVTVHHPNLAAVLDWGTDRWNDREVVYVVVEHLTGGSLREIIDRGRRLDASQALQVGIEVCRGLAMVHEVQRAHGDVRPSTIVFGDDGRARLVDLGIGEVLGASTWAEPSLVTNERAAYGAPELGQGVGISPAADVYAVAVTLLEATSGAVPLVSDTAVTTLAMRVDRLMPVSADLGALAAVLERAGRPDPADRWTAEQFGRALAQASANLPRPTPVPLVSAAATAAVAAVVADDVSPELRSEALTQAVPVVGAGAVLAGSSPDDPTFPTRRPDPAAPADLTIVEQTTDGGPTTVTPAVAAAPDVDGHTAVLPTTTADPIQAPAATRRSPWRRLRPGRILAAALVGLLVGAALGWVLTPVRSHEVPDLVGVERGNALNTISEFGWQVTVAREANDTVPVDAVIRTDPAAGSSVREGDAFLMVVSSGPAPRTLTDLTGLTVDAARAQVEGQGLVLQEGAAEFSETVPVGTIIRWSVPSAPGIGAGDTVVIGTTVEVIASAGPRPRSAPDLTGLDPAAALAALTAEGLTGNQLPDQQFSDTIAAGLVMSQDPPPGTELQRGAAVNFVVSKGPDVVPLPPLVGANLADATAALVASGFQVGQVSGTVTGRVVQADVGGTVIPDGGPAPRGATVNLALL